MPLVLQISIAVVAASFAVIAIAVFKAARSVERAEQAFSVTAEDLRKSIVEIRELTEQAQSVISTLGEASQEVRRTATKFTSIGRRIADLSSSVLSEVERPVRGAVATVRGLQSGAGAFVNRLQSRFRGAERRAYGIASNGGQSDV